ncbi:MAG: hypothetical protein ACR2FS_15165 [Phormidesmis sp.]
MAKKDYTTIKHPNPPAADSGQAITAKAAQVVQEQVLGASADIELISRSRAQAVDTVAEELHRLMSPATFNADILRKLAQLESRSPSGYASMLGGGNTLDIDFSTIRQEPDTPPTSIADFLSLPMAGSAAQPGQYAIAGEQADGDD